MEYKYERFDPDDEMVQLIRQGQEAISSFVEEDPSKINEIQPNGFTLLQIAAYEGCEDIVKFLLDHGADIHLRAYSDETALHLACDRGHEEIVKLLLKRPSQIKQKDEFWGNTALHFAARGGNEKIVQFILIQGIIDINIGNKFDRTALNLACFEGRENVVKLLINQGASVEYYDLRAAIKGKEKSIVELVLDSGVDINEKRVFTETLHLTCRYCKSSREEIIKLLVERGPEIDIEEISLMSCINLTAHDNNFFELLTDFATDIYIPSDVRATVRRLLSEGVDEEEIKTLIAKSSSKRLLSSTVKDEENESVVKLLLDHGVDVISERVFNACLHIAWSHGYEDIARKLFNRVPKASVKRKLDGNFVISAIRGGNRNFLQSLLNQNVDVNMRDDVGEDAAIHLACEKGDEDVVRMLIDHGADMKAIGYLGNTTLHYAAVGGNKDVCKLALDCELDVNLKNFNGETVLHIACKEGHEEILKILLQHDSLVDTAVKDWQTDYGSTALHFAARGGNKNIVKLLLDRGIEVDAINDLKESTLHLACEKGLEDIVQILIEYGANINIHNSSAYKSLKTNGIFINTKGQRYDNKGKSVLHSAVEGQNKNIVKSLLDGGVDVHSRDSDGATPLLLAVQRGNLEIIELLLKYGAKITDKDNQGYSVYHMIAKYQRPKYEIYDVTKRSTRSTRTGEEKIYVFSVLKINKVIKVFSNLGLDINCVDNMGNTPMHTVNEDCHNFEMVKLLVNYGADIFAKNNKRETALQLACYHELESSAKLLLDLGADVEAEDNRGVTVLASLTEDDCCYREKNVKLLLHYGANVDVSNNLKEPPLFCTKILSCYILLELFLDYGANVNDTKDGSSPLSLAMKGGSFSSTTGVQLLLDYGADIDMEDEQLIRIIGVEVTAYKSNPLYNYIQCANIITRHIVKLKAANEDVPDKILEDIESNDELKDYSIQCQREIDEMKSRDSELLLWRMLTSNHRCLAYIAKNEETVQFLASKECDLKYPIYSSVLKDQMRRGIWRKILLDKVKFFFKTIGEAEGNEHLPKLPNLCVEKILGFLSNRDFRNLIKVCDPFNDFDLDLCDVRIPK